MLQRTRILGRLTCNTERELCILHYKLHLVLTARLCYYSNMSCLVLRATMLLYKSRATYQVLCIDCGRLRMVTISDAVDYWLLL